MISLININNIICIIVTNTNKTEKLYATFYTSEQAKLLNQLSKQFGKELVLQSPLNAGAVYGVGWFMAIKETIDNTCVLDCGENTGAALSAMRLKITDINFSEQSDDYYQICQMAQKSGVRIHSRQDNLFDNPYDDFEHLCKKAFNVDKI